MSVEDHLLSASPHNYALYFLASTNKLGGHHLEGPVFEQILSESFSSRFHLLQIQRKWITCTLTWKWHCSCIVVNMFMF